MFPDVHNVSKRAHGYYIFRWVDLLKANIGGREKNGYSLLVLYYFWFTCFLSIDVFVGILDFRQGEPFANTETN